ncbi:unnamed protein product [Linum tenue]|uniref:Trichome birefringence-like C-terminal domain-containing protein n=1 Tax=Linum tenue TaxID=586396 RepID=A0AAV0MD47_9ROSI|nr:unnamed protein product [Linum tenue]
MYVSSGTTDAQEPPGQQFPQRMTRKSVMFVGDSISRDQFESLICMIVASLPRRTTKLNGGDPLSSIKFWNKSRCILLQQRVRVPN